MDILSIQIRNVFAPLEPTIVRAVPTPFLMECIKCRLGLLPPVSSMGVASPSILTAVSLPLSRAQTLPAPQWDRGAGGSCEAAVVNSFLLDLCSPKKATRSKEKHLPIVLLVELECRLTRQKAQANSA